jgi:succinoglycan biosynthesis transport protein ExoP
MSRTAELDNEIETFDPPMPAPSRGLFQILWQRKAFVVLGAFIGLACGFLYHTQKATVYESTCQLTVTKKFSMPSSNQGQQSGIFEDYISTHIAVLGSPLISGMAVRKQGLEKKLQSFEALNGNFDLVISQILAGLAVGRDVKLTPGTVNNIIVMSYRGPVAEDCKAILIALKESFQDHLDSKYNSGSDKMYELITKARDRLDIDLEKVNQDLLDYRKNYPRIVRFKDGASTDFDGLLVLDQAKLTHQLDLLKLETDIRVLKKAIKDGKSMEFLTYTKEAMQNQLEKWVKEPLVQDKARLAQLLTEFGPNHPSVKTVKKYIETLEAERQALVPDVKEKDPAKQILEAWLYKKQILDESLLAIEENLKAKLKEVGESSVHDINESKFRQKISGYNLLFQELMVKIKATDITKDTGGYDVVELRQPGIGVKVAPNAYQNLPAGLLLGLLAGVGLAYLADMADKSFRSPEEIRDHLGLPLVGHIPFFKPDPETAAKREAGESTIEPMLCCYFKPKSLDSEAYRAVRTALFFSTQGQGTKVIQVTSPNKGDGKSLMISNLAITTAQSGKRVLLIDADCRRPRQHKIFNIPNEVGLTTILTGNAMLQETIRPVCVEGLFVMGSGPIPPNPSELLVSPQFKELLDSVRGHYDYIFVDTPPLLAVTDPCVVAGKVDGLFLAIRLTRKGRPDAERAREILNSVNCKVLGIVVNGVTRVTSGLYSSHAYDYTDTYVDYEPEDKDYYYADEDPDEAAAKDKEATK